MKAWEWKGKNLSSTGDMEFEIVMDMILQWEMHQGKPPSVKEICFRFDITEEKAEELMKMISKVQQVHEGHHYGSFGDDLLEEWYAKKIITDCTPEQLEYLRRIHQKLNEKRKAEKATELRTAILHCENAGYTVTKV